MEHSVVIAEVVAL